MLINDFRVFITNNNLLQTKSFRNEILELQGLSDLENEITSVKNANLDGSNIISQSLNERSMVLVLRQVQDRDYYAKFFNAKHSFTMRIFNRQIDFKVESFKFEEQVSNLYELKAMRILCTAYNPYWRSTDNFGQNLAGVVPLFGFPWIATIDDGFAMGYKVFNQNTIFDNDGDVEVGFELKINVTGEMYIFKIENLDTGEFIQILDYFSIGDVIEISTLRGQKEIKVNGVSAINTLDKASTMFLLNIGANRLKFSAETGVTNCSVFLYYSPLYVNGMNIGVTNGTVTFG